MLTKIFEDCVVSGSLWLPTVLLLQLKAGSDLQTGCSGKPESRQSRAGPLPKLANPDPIKQTLHFSF